MNLTFSMRKKIPILDFLANISNLIRHTVKRGLNASKKGVKPAQTVQYTQADLGQLVNFHHQMAIVPLNSLSCYRNWITGILGYTITCFIYWRCIDPFPITTFLHVYCTCH